MTSTTLKHVYGQARPLPEASPPAPFPAPSLPFYGRKTIQEELDEIDKLADEDLPSISQPTKLTSTPPDAPASLNQSGALGSPSTNGPCTPFDLISSPNAQQEGRKRLRVVDSDHEQDEELDEVNEGLIKASPRDGCHHDSLPDIDPVDIVRARQVGPELSQTCEKKRQASETDSEETEDRTKKPKTKKIKALNKREQESVDRHVAALTREKDVKLIGTCKQPATTLDAVFAKLAQPNTKPLPKKRVIQTVAKKSTLSPSQTGPDFPSTSPRGLPVSSADSADSIEEREPALDQEEDLLEIDGSTRPTRPSPIPSLAARKQSWAAAAAKGKGKAMVEDSDDSDLEILPASGPSRSLVVGIRSSSKAVVSRKSNATAKVVRLPAISSNEKVMADLRKKCKVDLAMERMRKQREFGIVDRPKSCVDPEAVDIRSILDNQKEEDEEAELDEDGDWKGSGSEIGSIDQDEDEDDEAFSDEEAKRQQEDEEQAEAQDQPGRRKVLRVIESPEPDYEQQAMETDAHSDDDVSGFEPHALTPAAAISSPPSTTVAHQDIPLTAFGPTAADSPIPGFGATTEDDLLAGFTATATREGSPLHGFETQTSKASFTQLFEDEDETAFTHPPPPLLLQPKDATEESFLEGTCVLPSVKVLAEERERDMVAMMLAGQEEQEQEQEPLQYVNDRGLLTQNKPELFPPNSPLMSPDWVARTPFALRKDPIIEKTDDVLDEQYSPVKPLRLSMEAEEEEEELLQPSKNVFDAMMKKKVGDTGGKEKKKNKKGNPGDDKTAARLRKSFLLDQADESDEDEGILSRKVVEGSEEESSDSDSVIEDLVDDGADERNEEEKLEGERAAEMLAKKHEQEAEDRRAAHIEKVVAGRLRKNQARKHGGISESDEEDDEEEELFKARQRARQEQLRKNKKHKIHLLGSKHESFFKSYEEGTNQWADPEDMACLQPAEENSNNSDSSQEQEDYNDDDDGPVSKIPIQASRTLAAKQAREQKESEEELDGTEKEQEQRQTLNLNSSPVRLQVPKMKIIDPLHRQKPLIASSSRHGDIDGIYNTKGAHKLSDRQMSLKVDLDRPVGPSKSSSITYQHQRQEQITKQQKRAEKPRQGSLHKQDSAISVVGGLAKLKAQKKKNGSVSKLG